MHWTLVNQIYTRRGGVARKVPGRGGGGEGHNGYKNCHSIIFYDFNNFYFNIHISKILFRPTSSLPR